MKKIFSMFAFVAIMILGAVTLASCDKNDDNTGNAGDKHTYTFVAEFNTSTLPKETLDALNQYIKKSTESNPNFKTLNCTSGDAAIFWMDVVENQMKKPIQDIVDENAKEMKDRSLSLTLKMIEDGTKEFKSKTWTPSPGVFL